MQQLKYRNSAQGWGLWVKTKKRGATPQFSISMLVTTLGSHTSTPHSLNSTWIGIGQGSLCHCFLFQDEKRNWNMAASCLEQDASGRSLGVKESEPQGHLMPVLPWGLICLDAHLSFPDPREKSSLVCVCFKTPSLSSLLFSSNEASPVDP